MFSILTKSILNDLLAYWISLGDVGRLDSALCEPVQRKKFLNLLQTDTFGKRNSLLERYSCCNSFLTWVTEKNVQLKLNEFVLGDSLFGKWELIRLALATVGRNLKRVEYNNRSPVGIEYVDKILLELSLFCTNLQECEFPMFSDAPMAALLARNPHMRSVKLDKGAPNIESDILRIVSSLCSEIESLDLNFNIPANCIDRFLDSIPANLMRICVPFQGFSHSSLLNLLHQCPQLIELYIGQYVGSTAASTQPAHQCLKYFRFCSAGDIAVIVPGLSTRMPNLVTLIIVDAPHNYYKSDTSANVELILNSFRYLRQLLMNPPAGENKFNTLPSISNFAATRATQEKPEVPEVGSLLEELFSENVSEVAQTMVLPALRNVGCSHMKAVLLPHTVKRVMVMGWQYQSDDYMKKVTSLEEIELEISSGVGDEGMCHIARQNPNLRVLRITQKLIAGNSYTMISAAGLWTILQHCPLLHTVVYIARRSDWSACATEILLHRMCLKLYPNIKHFEYSV